MALSADSDEEAAATAKQLGLEFPLGYGLDVDAVSLTIGCYTGKHESRPHLQPAAFVLAPDGSILHSVYSSGKVGRLTASDALTLLRARKP